MRRLSYAAAAVVLVASYGCSSTSTPKAQPTTVAPTTARSTSPARTPATTPSYYRQRLSWHDCGSGFTCATLKVPLDYAHPSTLISLSVVRLPASNRARRIGSLVVNPGGPGGSGVDYAKSARKILPTKIRDRFDIVGFDPRGVARSRPAVRCLTYPQLDQFFAANPAPDTPADRRMNIALAQELASGCKKRSGDALLSHVATVDVARDLDVLRAALGDARLTYVGKSYGTFIGAVYAELFPTHIRALVLDGAIDPRLTGPQEDRAQALGFERALRSYFSYCDARSDCPLGHGSNIDRNFRSLVAQLDRSNLPAPEASGHRHLAAGNVFLGIAQTLYSKSYWPYLTAALRQAQNGDGSILLALSDLYSGRNPDGTYDNEIEANAAVNCTDRPEPRQVAAYDAEARQLAQVAPHFGAVIGYGALSCAFWPVPPRDHPHAIRAAGAPPIVVVGTTRDPATPYEWAQGLASQLVSGVLLSYDGDGHTVYGGGESACVDDLVNAYLLNLQPPRNGTLCH